MADETNRKAPSAWAFVGGGLQLCVCVVGGLVLGRGLDGRWGTEPWWMVTGGALGFGVGLYTFLSPLFKK